MVSKGLLMANKGELNIVLNVVLEAIETVSMAEHERKGSLQRYQCAVGSC